MEGLTVLSSEEVARIFGCKARWAVRHWVQIGGVKIGRKTVFLKANVEAALLRKVGKS
jgi:hypothetical protein